MFCPETNHFCEHSNSRYTHLNGSDLTQLENWLTDIETAVNLTDESRTKLAQAKSKGLMHTLVTEAITPGKNWEEIKDSLHLKLCNSNIHTSISCFMDIQQKNNEIVTLTGKRSFT